MEAENRDCLLSPFHLFLWIPIQEFCLCPDLPYLQIYCVWWNLMLVKVKNLNSVEEDVLFTMELNCSAFQMNHGFSLFVWVYFQFIYRESSVNSIMMQRLKRKRKSVSFTSRVTAPKERTAFICTISFKSTSNFTWNVNFIFLFLFIVM